MLMFIILFTLIACGSDSSNRTFSKYISKENIVIFYIGETIKKDEIPSIIFFQNNKMGAIPSELSELTWGELSKLSDEEIIKKAIKEFADGDEDKFFDSFIDYVLCGMTDDTGNVVKEEAVVFKYGWMDFTSEPTSGVIYDSYYCGYKSNYDTAVVVRCKEGTIPFILDDANSEEVEIDISPEELLDSWREAEELQKQLEELSKDYQG